MPESVRQRIYEAIRDEITYGELLPGERITEKELSEKFQASRSTIRECLRQLESEGLLTFESHKGFRVSKLSTRQVEEIYDLRGLLESYSTRLTAERATPAQVAHLEKLQEGCRKAARKNDLKAWLKYNNAFHLFFYENSGNDNLKLLLDTMKRRIYRYHYIIIQIPGHFENYLAQHQKIIEACRSNDGRTAEKYMKMHLRGIKDVLLEQFKKFPGMHPG